METNSCQNFSTLAGELCSLLCIKGSGKEKINSILDELNALPYKTELFVGKHDAAALINVLCFNVKPVDEFLAAKISHLINSILIKQNIDFDSEFLWKVLLWHIDCLKKCSDIILPDILHNLQCILQSNPQSAHKLLDELISKEGILVTIINTDKSHLLGTHNPIQICLIALKCILCLLTTLDENKSSSRMDSQKAEMKEHICKVIIQFLMKGSAKTQDESLYCKVIISALRVLSHLYFSDQKLSCPLPQLIGICRYFILYGLLKQNSKPEKIMPAQQTVAPESVKIASKGGKKQKLRKQRNNVAESLKKEIPVSDHSLMRDVDNFENNSAYKPISVNCLEPQKAGNCWVLTSDSDMSDIENGKEAKLITLKSRVRQSAANLFLVLFKVKEKKELFGYWWALLPDSPDANNWCSDPNAKKSLAYCALVDPIVSSRASTLSVILALLSGSRMYLSQAEVSKKDNASFIPFSISLGYIITCMHKILVGILDSERSQAVILVALKCCAALVQATPYHKLQDGLISDLVRSTRKFLVHRDVKLQVGTLITIGCVLSVDTKVKEILKAMEKDTLPMKNNSAAKNVNMFEDKNCGDFEEGYSDDEMFTAGDEYKSVDDNNSDEYCNVHFKSWILDICFRNIGWLVRGNTKIRCKPSAIPIMLESLQVLSAIAFHHLSELLKPHIMLLADVLCEMLQHEHHDVVLQAARTVSVIGDGIQKLELMQESPPLNQCIYMWENLLPPLSAVLQSQENPAAKAVVCDCIANIGEKCFKELPNRVQMLCCALLMGSCSDEEASVRAAAVRALAMAVMYRTLREDICFVSDCGENILRAISEQTLVVRIKVAWALGNLSDALVLNMEEPDLDDIDDDLLLRLLEVSVKCATDNDKIKMSATRALGNFLRIIKNEHILRMPQMKTLCETAIEKLLDCACKVNNMKVRWNACYALGNAMKNDNLFTCFTGWQNKVFSSLCTLVQECKNLKVRINAAVALRAPSRRAQYGAHVPAVWRAVMAAAEHGVHLDDFTEYAHKDKLIEQLCVTLAHICCLLKQTDLTDIFDPLVFHGECAKSCIAQVFHKLPPENSSCLKILQAAKYVTVDLMAETAAQMQCLSMLQDIFIWDV